MNNGHRERGWVHKATGYRRTRDGWRIITAIRDADGARCWRLFCDDLEVGKSAHWSSIARWVRRRSYMVLL